MGNKKITDFPQVYSDYPCKDCITLPMCLCKKVNEIAHCPLVKSLFLGHLNMTGEQKVFNLDQYPTYKFLVGIEFAGQGMDTLRIVAQDLGTGRAIICQ